MKNNVNSNNTLALVNADQSLQTLKGVEPGDTLVIVHEDGGLTLQGVLNRVGHRGRENGHVEIRLMDLATQGMVDHLLYSTLPAGFVSVMKVQLPRRADKSATPKTTKVAVVTRPSQSVSREVAQTQEATQAPQEAQQSTETTVVAEAQAVMEAVAVEPVVEAPAAVEVPVEEQVSMEVAAEALASSVVPQEPQAEAVSVENIQVDQPVLSVPATEN